MKNERFSTITRKYSQLRVAIVGDFCLDRYLEIDPNLKELSLETNLPVYNVTRVRAQPGAGGTILNNLVALGIGTIYPVAFCGEDGEGFELRQALQRTPGVKLDYFFTVPSRKTFTYCKPLLLEKGKGPRELNRLDQKNWSETSPLVQEQLAEAITKVTAKVDAVAVLDQVDLANTGVVTPVVLAALYQALKDRLELVAIADSRRGLRGFPPFSFKMNRAELARFSGTTQAKTKLDLEKTQAIARELAQQNGRDVFVTLSEEGILGVSPTGHTVHAPCLPLRGEIDIVGAGDAVTANLCAALAAGACLEEAVQLANTAASVVIHQLGTTGTASIPQLRELLA